MLGMVKKELFYAFADAPNQICAFQTTVLVVSYDETNAEIATDKNTIIIVDSSLIEIIGDAKDF